MSAIATATAVLPASVGPEAALRTRGLLRPWALRRGPGVLTFRGRVREGTSTLPVAPVAEVSRGITYGLASTPVLLRNVGGSYPVPANTPWAVASDGTWRVVLSQHTDLRLVHVGSGGIDGPALLHRPIRFTGEERKVMRAAIKSITPIWVDDRSRPIANLTGLPVGDPSPFTVRPLGPLNDQDLTAGFYVMARYGLASQESSADQRLGRAIDHIESQLSDPALNVAAVASATKLSRRTLQTLFVQVGGVASYIRKQRLAAVLRHLTADAERFPDLDVVAAATGFGSRRTLERAMRQTYGLTPKQARSHVLAGSLLREVPVVAELRAS
ncbi:MAG: hypothetical protein JWQ74_1862 [Marmoricola sp.]|nr:hypothetical protein [Marmoricola sp.]